MNIFPGNKRYNSYNEYFKRTFGSRVQKVSIDAGFTCPNRDGTAGSGGCTYCNNDAFNPSYCIPSKSITQQIEEGIAFHKVRYRRAMKYLAYFQTYSNTYAPLAHLKEIYEEALQHPDVAGLVIGTRTDCMDDEKLAYFSRLSDNYYVMIEYGLETTNEQTLMAINRGHTMAQAAAMIRKTADYGLKTGIHLIFGLPGETRQEMLDRAGIISALPLTTVKFHQLQIVKGTKMAMQFREQPGMFSLFSLEEYISFIVSFIERLNPSFVIERFTGEVPPRFLESQPWSNLRADQVAIMIEEELTKRDTWQGRYFRPQL
ncbi:radical SAM protein, TIGR01212 family [Lentimicrobium saccharophilum]|uniref:Radical SAM protein, TIGR01212 family n=1 Tax=Lentimicrobium saccharophilum TaxID=1678841 RepID=A0A0S7BQ52_9BACT|nr:TIGR01212 family radical SAM protein [Lentimicrobium saccharophilum]GAP42540.1 radical SAM protein, TIGR01212 family [Lentimicrobium saccharophilum]